MSVQKVSVVERMEQLGVTKKQLIVQTGLHRRTLERAMYGGGRRHSTSLTAASLIAKALDTEVRYIKFPHGVSDTGRPAGSISTHAEVRRLQAVETSCKRCTYVLLRSGECSNGCSNDLCD